MTRTTDFDIRDLRAERWRDMDAGQYEMSLSLIGAF